MKALADGISPRLFLTGVLSLYVLCAGSIFLSYLPPQTDEELFSEPARNLATEGRLVSHIVLGMDEGVLWQPPLYFVLLAGVIAIFGYSLEVVRAFNVAIGCAVLILTYILGRKLFSEKSARIAVFLLSFDPFFLLYSKMGRMDILCLAFILSSLCLALWSSSRDEAWPWLLTGLSSAAAALTHPLGTIAPIAVVIWQISHEAGAHRGRTASLLAFLAPLFIVVLATALYVWNHMSPFVEQMAFQFGRKDKNLIASWSDWLVRFKFLPILGATTLFCLALSLKGSVSQWRTSSAAGLAFIVTSLLIVGIASAFETSYQLYLQPFVVLIICGIIVKKRTRTLMHWESLFPIFPTALGLNFALYLVVLNVGLHEARRDDTASIDSLFERITTSLPERSHVLALGSPSLYWQLRTERPDIVFVSDTFLSEKRGREGVGKIDRVVMTRSFDPGTDDRWHASEYQRLEGIAETLGRHMVKIASVGTRKRFSYSAVVFKVEKDDNAHSSYP